MTAGSSSSPYVDPSSVPVGTNAEWLNKAVALVADTFGTSRLDVQAALQTYLMGNPLTLGQRVIVARALAANGLPPEGVSGLVNGGEDTTIPPTPTPTPTPKLPTKWTPTKDQPHYGGFVVDAGDTLAAISYASGTSVAKLMLLNGIADPNAVLTPGTRIKTE